MNIHTRHHRALLFTPLEFDLAYLILLTENGLKPLSRWEGIVPNGIEEVMAEMGLEFACAERLLQNGKSSMEFIFSKSRAHLDLYLDCFDHSLIDKSLETQRFEGYLFGFPPCCVESFIQFGYQPNGLNEADQRLLFHWACPDCRVTPLLLSSYRRVHCLCAEILARQGRSTLISRNQSEVARKILVALSVLGLAATGSALSASNSSQTIAQPHGDVHWLPWPSETDKDGDLLPDDDEPYLGMQPNNPDTDGNGVLDGVQLAKAAYALYAMLAHGVQTNGPYVLDYLVYGLETCSVCGETTNMGYVEIINPLENIAIQIPYIALHYLAHGSYQYAGDVHASGRIEIRRCRAVLEGDGTWHRLNCHQGDADGDGLSDADEPYLGTDTTKIDSDGDGVIDGTQLSRAFAAIVDSLPRVVQANAPYAEDHKMRGLVTCARCGELVNMGYVRAINPLENQWIDLPYLALHYMHCAGFAYGDTAAPDVIDPRVLQTVLKSDGTVHQLPVGHDADSDGLVDKCEPRFHCLVGNPDTDGDGVSDGVQLARQLWKEIEGLPRQASPGPYRLEHEAKGVETCEMCGLDVNMGYAEIVNTAENHQVNLPYINLHYLQHGSFAARGTEHRSELIDARTLDCVLHGDGAMHLLPISDDADGDGLTGTEEERFATQPNLPDTDNDGYRDGVDVSRWLAARIDSLPRTPQPDRSYRLDYQANGVEECEICGELLNMGFASIVNPTLRDSLMVPFIALHAMQHAGFSYDGSVHDGRVDPVKLADVLGVGSVSSVWSSGGTTPTGIALLPCFPNPFNSSTSIRYYLSAAAFVRLGVYNMLGQNIRNLLSAPQPPGEHQIRWDGLSDAGLAMPSGPYLVHLQVGNETRMCKATVVR